MSNDDTFSANPRITERANQDIPLPIFVDHQLMQACDQLIRMPMLGRSDSLNLAVATGVVLYEALRHRQPAP